MTVHECPGGCGVRVAYVRLACNRCWARLPKPLRDDVLLAYRWRKDDPMRHLRAVSKALEWFRDQRPTAIDS